MNSKASAKPKGAGSQALKKDRNNNTGLNMLRTVNYIYKHGSAQAPVTISQISNKLGISNKVVDRLLNDELAACEEIQLVSLYKHNNRFIPEEEYLALHEDDPAGYPVLHKCRYYYIQNTWSVSELLTLTNAIGMIECVNPIAARAIISKLASYNDIQSAGVENDREEFIRQYPMYRYLGSNLAAIHKAISGTQCISFSYGKYNSHLMLVTSEIVTAAPVAVMHYHSYYYLVAYNPEVKDIRHYRIERIVGAVRIIRSSFSRLPQIEELKKLSVMPILSYTATNVKMQGGKTLTVRIVCSERIANNFVDAFGPPDVNKATNVSTERSENYAIIAHSPDDHRFHPEEGTFTADLKNVTADGIVIWASQFCSDCEIIAPDECRRRLRERLAKALERYSKPIRSL